MKRKAKQNKVKPTKKQMATIKILAENPEMPVGEAMKLAGYTKQTAINPKENFVDARGTQIALKKWRSKLNARGINEDKLADKYAEWLDAQKAVSARVTGKDADSGTDDFIDVPDYQTQIKAGEWLRKDFGLSSDKNVNISDSQVVVLPSTVIDKYGTSSDTDTGS